MGSCSLSIVHYTSSAGSKKGAGAKMDMEDGLKLGGYMTGAILFDDYAIKQGWYKRSLMPPK